ncbi:MAG TPA: polymer-forming cytoskeletal protein [Acidimicrobiia bacterium]|nr:polymer-forming cytoskeletal protein [Acidimicrobiia bacterium]
MLRRRHRDEPTAAPEQAEPEIAEALGRETTVVSRGAELEGTLVSAESIRIEGQAKGLIAARGDVILSSDSNVEADIQAQNVVMGGTLKGNITARTKTELAEGGRVEGKIRSRVLVVQEGAVFYGQSDTRLEEAGGPPDRSDVPKDDLQNAYDQATQRAADWYRTRLPGPKGAPDRAAPAGPSTPGTPTPQPKESSGPQETVPARGHHSLPFPRLARPVSTEHQKGEEAPAESADIER